MSPPYRNLDLDSAVAQALGIWISRENQPVIYLSDPRNERSPERRRGFTAADAIYVCVKVNADPDLTDLYYTGENAPGIWPEAEAVLVEMIEGREGRRGSSYVEAQERRELASVQAA